MKPYFLSYCLIPNLEITLLGFLGCCVTSFHPNCWVIFSSGLPPDMHSVLSSASYCLSLSHSCPSHTWCLPLGWLFSPPSPQVPHLCWASAQVLVSPATYPSCPDLFLHELPLNWRLHVVLPLGQVKCLQEGYSRCLSDTAFSVSCTYSRNHTHFPCSSHHSVVKSLNAYSMIGSELRNKDSKDQFYVLVLDSECLFKYFLCFNPIPAMVKTFTCPACSLVG